MVHFFIKHLIIFLFDNVSRSFVTLENKNKITELKARSLLNLLTMQYPMKSSELKHYFDKKVFEKLDDSDLSKNLKNKLYLNVYDSQSTISCELDAKVTAILYGEKIHYYNPELYQNIAELHSIENEIMVEIMGHWDFLMMNRKQFTLKTFAPLQFYYSLVMTESNSLFHHIMSGLLYCVLFESKSKEKYLDFVLY